MRRLRRTAIGLAAATCLAACGGETVSPGADGAISMSIGLATASAAVDLGIDNGVFEAEGLNVETAPVENAPARVAAVQSGTVDVVELPTTAFLKAVEKGLPLYALAAQYGYPADTDTDPYENIDVMVAADSPIEDMSDLGGAQIGVPARQDLMEIMASGQIAGAGADPSTVQWRVLDFTSQIAALQEGRLDAIMAPFPFNVKAQQAGARSIARPAGAFFETAPTTIWAVGQGVADDPELAKRIQRAIYTANAYANANKDELTADSAERMGIPIETFALAGAEFYFPLTLEAADLQRTADKMHTLGFLPSAVAIAEHVLEQEPLAAPTDAKPGS